MSVPVCEKFGAKSLVQQPATIAPVIQNADVKHKLAHVSSVSVTSPEPCLEAVKSVPTSAPEAYVSINGKDMLAFLTGKQPDLPQKFVYK